MYIDIINYYIAIIIILYHLLIIIKFYIKTQSFK